MVLNWLLCSSKIFFSLNNIRFTRSGLNYFCKSFGLKTCISMRDDNFNSFHLCNFKKLSDEKVHKIVNLGKPNDYAYDMKRESHDFYCGFPLKVHNTGSFVFSVSTRDIIEDSQNAEDFFDFSNLSENGELFSNKL